MYDSIAAMDDIVQSQLLMMRSQLPGVVRRGQHPKAHGLVKATVEVSSFRYGMASGLFAEPGRYEAWIRFSSGRAGDDRKPDVHGAALKILTDRGDHDLLLSDSEFFFFKDVPQVQAFFRAAAQGSLLRHLAVNPSLAWRMFRSFRWIASPLSTAYHSQTAYRLGDGPVRYHLTPMKKPNYWSRVGRSPDYLGHRLNEQLKTSFLFNLEAEVPGRGDTVDGVSSPWHGHRLVMARVFIDPQDCRTPEMLQAAESLVFSPWNYYPEMEPLGAINLLRRLVYDASANFRKSKVR